jgi:hypothetical protein
MSIKILAAFIFATDILFTNEKHHKNFVKIDIKRCSIGKSIKIK